MNRLVTVEEYMRARVEHDPDVERRFLFGLRMRNGLFKGTHERRLDDTTALLLPWAKALPFRPLTVLDVGCSTGISTLELHNALLAHGLDCRTTGMDLEFELRSAPCSEGVNILYDLQGRPLQVDIGNWAMSWKMPPGKKDIVCHPRKVLRALWTLYTLKRTRDQHSESMGRGNEVRTVPLIDRRALGIPGLKFAQGDILRPNDKETYCIIRAVNVLNRTVLDRKTLDSMLEGLKQRLCDGGLLLLGRACPSGSGNDAALYQKQGNRYNRMGSINGGSELDDSIVEG